MASSCQVVFTPTGRANFVQRAEVPDGYSFERAVVAGGTIVTPSGRIIGHAFSTPETRQSGSRSGRGARCPAKVVVAVVSGMAGGSKEASQLRVSPHDIRVQLRQSPVTDAA